MRSLQNNPDPEVVEQAREAVEEADEAIKEAKDAQQEAIDAGATPPEPTEPAPAEPFEPAEAPGFFDVPVEPELPNQDTEVGSPV